MDPTKIERLVGSPQLYDYIDDFGFDLETGRGGAELPG